MAARGCVGRLCGGCKMSHCGPHLFSSKLTKGSFSRLVARSAELSTDGRYRYSLSRVWDDSLPIVLFIGLNPSTADHERDDPTIRRCMRFAQDWGCGTLLMGNLFALRSTDPRTLLSDPAPVGPANDEILSALARRAAVRVAAWGGHRAGSVRAASVAARLGTLLCLERPAGVIPGIRCTWLRTSASRAITPLAPGSEPPFQGRGMAVYRVRRDGASLRPNAPHNNVVQ